MKKEYDWSKGIRNPYAKILKAQLSNPYAKILKRQITIRLDPGTIGYFQGLSGETGLPYQTLINMYLKDCAQTHRKLKWLPGR